MSKTLAKTRINKHDGPVQVELDGTQWTAVSNGELTGPDGVRYSRRSTRMKRRDADELVQNGSPVVVYYWAGGLLTWHDGSDAADAWRDVRTHLTSSPPRPTSKRMVWTAGSWEGSDDLAILVVTGHC